MQERVESICELVVPCCEAPKLFEAIEESLDEVSSLVAMPVDFPLVFSVASRRNDGLCARPRDLVNESVTVVTLISDDGPRLKPLDQSSALCHIRDLSGCQDQANRAGQRIDASVNLGGQPAAGTADRLIATVFFGAPAACWWARTIVASTKSSSRSASACNASATRCQTPYVSQRAKRTYTECQLPNSFGKSRHGQPVRATYRIASTKLRLSAARPPLSVGLPGSKSDIRFHCISFNIRRSIEHIQIAGCKHKSVTVNRP